MTSDKEHLVGLQPEIVKGKPKFRRTVTKDNMQTRMSDISESLKQRVSLLKRSITRHENSICKGSQGTIATNESFQENLHTEEEGPKSDTQKFGNI